MTTPTPARQLDTFLRRFSPEIVALAKAARAKFRRRFPRAIEMVYDNYNALVIGFSSSERPSDAILSIGLYPRWVNLYFLQDATDLPDPDGLLRGSGNWVRSVRLTSADDIQNPAVRALIAEAVTRADPPIDPTRRRRLTIRAASAKRRLRK
jgi:hypothetical protein